MMRRIQELIAAGGLLAIVACAPGAAQAGQCPANAFKASTAIWNWGDLQYGETRTATHPCGRRITCTGGKFQPKILRQCRWN